MISPPTLAFVLFLSWLVPGRAIHPTYVSYNGVYLADMAFTASEKIYINTTQPIEAIRIGIILAHGYPEDLEVHLLPPWSDWTGITNGSFSSRASDILTFSPSAAVTLFKNLAIDGSTRYLGNLTENEMYWVTSPIDPIWSGPDVKTFVGSKQSTVSGLFLPTDSTYTANSLYQQNKMRKLIGQSPFGEWQLLFADSQSLDDGVLYRWSIELLYCGDRVLLTEVEECDGTTNCGSDCRCTPGCTPTVDGTCQCLGPIRPITESVGDTFAPDDVFQTVPTEDGNNHVTFFRNSTTGAVTAELITSDDILTRVVAANGTVLAAVAKADSLYVLRVYSDNGVLAFAFTNYSIATKVGTELPLGELDPASDQVSGVILLGASNIVVCVTHFELFEGYETECTVLDAAGSVQSAAAWEIENSVITPAMILLDVSIVQLYITDSTLWTRDSAANVTSALFTLPTNSPATQLTAARTGDDTADVTVVQSDGHVTVLTMVLSTQSLVSSFTERVASANQLTVMKLYDNVSLAVYTSPNNSLLATRFINDQSQSNTSYNLFTGSNLQSNGAISLSQKRFMITWSGESQKRQSTSSTFNRATFTTCGNGVVVAPKECDGGPNCSEYCLCADGYYPTTPLSLGCVSRCGDKIAVGPEECDGGLYCTNCTCNFGYEASTPLPTGSCIPACGDGYVMPGELCDHGTDPNCDLTCRCKAGMVSRSGKCVVSRCGDRLLDSALEVCDSGPGCDDCFCAEGYVPTLPPSLACVVGSSIMSPWYYPPGDDPDEPEGFFETFGFISVILFVLFMVMLVGCVAGTIALTVIVVRRRRARIRQQFFNQNIEMEPKESSPAPVEPEVSIEETVTKTPTSPKKKDFEKDLDFGDLGDH